MGSCTNQYIVKDCCDATNVFRVSQVCLTGLNDGDIFYTIATGYTNSLLPFSFSGCVVVSSTLTPLANTNDTYSANTSYTACTDCITLNSLTPCVTPTVTPTPTTTNTSGLIYTTAQMSLPANLTVGMVVTDSNGNCWEIIATTGTTPSLTWGNQIFPVGGCASCLTVNPCPTLTPTTTPTNTPTITPTHSACQAYNIQVGSGVSGCTFSYTDCSGNTQTVTILSGNSNTVCSLTSPTTSCGLTAYTMTNIGSCCQSYYIQVGSGVSGCTFTYVNCSGNTQTVTITSGMSNTVCSLSVPTTPCGASAYTITNQGLCCQTYNITVNTASACTFNYINCSGFNQTITINSGASASICSITSPSSSCPTSAYTMTLSGNCCTYYNLSVLPGNTCTFNYINCSGGSQSVVVTTGTPTNVCSQVLPTTTCNPTGYTITSATTCNPCLNLTLGVNPKVTGCTFTYVDCSGVTQTVTVLSGSPITVCSLTIPTSPCGTVTVNGPCTPSTCYYVALQPSIASCYIDYTDPVSGFTTLIINSGGTTQVCSTTVPVASSIYAVCSPSDIIIIQGSACTYNVGTSTWDCPSGNCQCWNLYIDPPTICNTQYVDCDGNIQFLGITGGTPVQVCSLYEPSLTFCGVSYTATTSGQCGLNISGVYECLPCADSCVVFGNGTTTGTLWTYDLATNSTITTLQTLSFFDDIANDSTNYWTVSGGNIISEYTWTVCPLTSSNLVRTITITGFTGSLLQGFCAVSGNTLVGVDSGSNNIYELDITTTNAVETLKVTSPVGRVFDGDIAYTTGNRLLTITSGASGYYITQFDYATGAQEIDILWTGTQKPQAFIFSGGTNLLVCDFVGDLYDVTTTSQTYLYPLPIPFPTVSQDPLCCNVTLCTGNTTCYPWLWNGSTPYLYNFIANTSTDISSIFTSGLTTSEAVALSENYFFEILTSPTRIRQFELSSCNNYASPIKNYGVTHVGSNKTLAAIDNSTLIYVDGVSQNLVEATVNPVASSCTINVLYNLQTNQPTRFWDYDLLYSTYGKVIGCNQDTGTTTYYLTQFDYTTGAIEVDVNISGFTSTFAPKTIFVRSGNLYVVLNNGDVYSVGLSSPYTATFIQNAGVGVQNGAQRPRCVNVLMS